MIKARPSSAASQTDAEPKQPSKLDRVEELLRAANAPTLADLVAATGWQAHSVRGALAGALKKRGNLVVSDNVDGVRRYRIAATSSTNEVA